MKKIFAVLPLLIFSYLAGQAQFTKGDILLGGTLNFSTQSSNIADSNLPSTTFTNFSIGPRVGYFINENTLLGATVGFSGSHSQSGMDPNIFKSDNNSFFIGVFGRKYFTITDKFFFAAQGEIDFSRGTTKNTSGSSVSETSSYSVAATVTPLLIFLPSPHWGIEGGIGSLGYTHNRNLTTNDYSNRFGLTAGGISFGVTYYFRK